MDKKYIYKNQSSLWGEPECIGFGTDEFYVKEIDRKLADTIIIKNHYSKKVVSVPHHKLDLGVFYKNNLKGVLQYGFAMNPASCGNVVKGTKIDEYLELNRMWISDDCKQYAESQAISYSIKYIKKKIKKIKWIQSFADERCGGFGIVYQACSFDYYGEHKSDFWEFEGEIYHNSIVTNNNRNKKRELEKRGFIEKAIKKTLRQFRYIKFIDKREKKNCLLKQMPYPKHYNEGVKKNG